MDESQGCVEDFMSGKETTFPPELPEDQELLFCALRQVGIEGREGRSALQDKLTELTDKVSGLSTILFGVLPDRSNGLMGQININTRFRKAITWVLSGIGVAFLGGAGIWMWGVLVP
ncbi:unnamed protein product [marine sediment metagenome]|uniref:Uncharacterized protein n=1 Tax=marine sediment metagenome TaxID=412755 RepID=X0V5K2_9ZZZZ